MVLRLLLLLASLPTCPRTELPTTSSTRKRLRKVHFDLKQNTERLFTTESSEYAPKRRKYSRSSSPSPISWADFHQAWDEEWETKTTLLAAAAAEPDCDIATLTNFAWALPKRETIIGMSEAIFLSGGTAVSIGAGLGAIEYLLSLTPLVTKLSATDNFSSHGTSDLKDRAYYDVANLDAKTAVSNTTANCLILIWPPYNDPMAHKALIIFQKKANPASRVIYWGEEMGGCTPNNAFHLATEWTVVK